MSHTGWIFTSYANVALGVLPLNCRYLVYQLERCPKTGRLHFQGYVEHDRKVRMATIKKLLDDPKVHLEPRYGQPSEARAYCIKDETRQAGPWEFGVCPLDQGHRCDLAEACAIVRSRGLYALYDEGFADHVILQYSRGLKELHSLRLRSFAFTEREIEVVVVHGPAGVGKTRAVYDAHGYRNVYSLPRSNTRIPWFESYDGQEVLLIDEMSPNMFDFEWLMMCLDRYPMQCPVKGSAVWAAWTQVYITSNHHPSTWYDWSEKPRDALYRRLKYKYVFMPSLGEKVVMSLPMSHSGGGGNTITPPNPNVPRITKDES